MSIDIKLAQKRLLNMALNIRDILERNDIPYAIMFGTLLGAVRHQGFIPWDDDFDFILFDDSYDQAISILRKELPSDIFIEDKETEENFFHAWARAKCKNSVTECELFPLNKIYKNQGLAVDLFKATKMREQDLSDYRQKEKEIYFEKIKNLGLISSDEYTEKIKSITNKDINSQELIYGFVFAKVDRIYENTMWPLRKYNFEGHEFYGPFDSNKILNLHYGDFMKIPRKEDQRNHYSVLSFIENNTTQN